MMEFIFIPAIVGICIYGVYSIFELFARRKERMAIIEKLGDKLGPDMIDGKLKLPVIGQRSFSALKAAGLLTGLGLGLLVGFLIGQFALPYYGEGMAWETRQLLGVVYGASVLLFGGLGLLFAFLFEYKQSQKNEK